MLVQDFPGEQGKKYDALHCPLRTQASLVSPRRDALSNFYAVGWWAAEAGSADVRGGCHQGCSTRRHQWWN
jgi:hypothetical protein